MWLTAWDGCEPTGPIDASCSSAARRTETAIAQRADIVTRTKDLIAYEPGEAGLRAA